MASKIIAMNYKFNQRTTEAKAILYSKALFTLEIYF